MQDMQAYKNDRRISIRHSIKISITFRPFISKDSICVSNGVMINFSKDGAAIKTLDKYPAGTILIFRIVGCHITPSSTAEKITPRSIGLSEVMWCKELFNESLIGYGMGIKYLD